MRDVRPRRDAGRRSRPPACRSTRTLRALRQVAGFALALGLSLATTGCVLITNLDRLQGRCDVDLTLKGMQGHVDLAHRFEVQVVDNANVIQSRALLVPTPMADFRVHMPSAVPVGDHRLRFGADISRSGVIGDSGMHVWELLDACGTTPQTFTHTGNYAPFATVTPLGTDLQVALTDVPMNGATRAFEVQVRAIVSQTKDGTVTRTVGVYHTPEITTPTMSVTVPGVVPAGMDLIVSLWLDLDGDGAYGAPPIDAAWQQTVAAANTGMPVTISYTTADQFDIGGIMVTKAQP